MCLSCRLRYSHFHVIMSPLQLAYYGLIDKPLEFWILASGNAPWITWFDHWINHFLPHSTEYSKPEPFPESMKVSVFDDACRGFSAWTNQEEHLWWSHGTGMGPEEPSRTSHWMMFPGISSSALRHTHSVHRTLCCLLQGLEHGSHSENSCLLDCCCGNIIKAVWK